MKIYKIALGCDHAGYATKENIKSYLEELGYAIRDFGTYSEESVDYPDYVHPLAKSVENGDYNFGIIFCGSGNGVNIVANKYQGIRSALCWTDEIACLARQHNNANVCAIPARFLDIHDVKKIVKTFIESVFEGGRHSNRVDKIPIKHA
ncbi:MAG: ribose 5-phosphate isomerase B [Bacteroidales bacterium]|nr:ribose 5-phosphate isomerase B [Bacteroidales bacterium]